LALGCAENEAVNRRDVFSGITALTLLLASRALCDYTPTPPAERTFASAKGDQRFRLSGQNDGVLCRFDRSGKERTLWTAHLVCQPQSVFVPDGPRRVVTIDQWGVRGYKHCVVVYGSAGEPLADYSLEDLLSPVEIRHKIVHSASNRAWTAGADFSFTRRRFRIDLRWRVLRMNICKMEWVYLPGRRLIEIDLKTGRLAKSKVFPEKEPPHED